MSDYVTLTGKSNQENKVTSNFDFNVENLVAREQATFFKSRIADIEKEKMVCRARIELLKSIKDGHRLRTWRNHIKVRLLKHKLNHCSYEDSFRWFKVSGELEMKKKNAYERDAELFRAYANLHSGTKANTGWLDIHVIDKYSLLCRRLF